jgi:serine/threonine protein kinase
MQLTCPQCQRILEFLGERPSFCAYCGQALRRGEATVEFLHEAETTPPGPSATDGSPTSVPEVVGGYRLLRQLGEGGMGAVYEAEDVASGRRVAVKLISPDAVASPDAVERFRQEGRLASAIAHPRCVFVLAADEQGGWPYIVMELMPGTTLEDLVLREGPLPPRQGIARILDVIEGLQEIHRHSIVHRDVKPSNCFIDQDGRVKVGDFGLARSLTGNVRLTRTGSFLGTPLYASPEQVRAEPVDQQSDVYSVAATLYFLLTGRAPFQTNDLAATLARIAADRAPSMRKLRPELDPGLDQVVLTGLERDRSRRWHDLGEFRDALLRFQPGHVSRSTLGVRFAAYLVDYVVMMVLATICLVVLTAVWDVQWMDPENLSPLNPSHFVGEFLPVLYFGLLEGLWGASLGKALLRLRVQSARGTSAAGLWRSCLRSLVFVILSELGTVVGIVLWLLLVPSAMSVGTLGPGNATLVLLVSLLSIASTVLGYGLIMLPMRARNGYRGLHEFLSSTRVVSLSAAEGRRAGRGYLLEARIGRPEGCPERLGPFAVRGAVLWDERAKIVVGQDSVLGREVWLWLRPQTEPPLSEARCRTSRATRLRWLACGKHDELQWDGFIAPTGCPLPALVQTERRLSWPEVRPILEQLTAELIAARRDGTLPVVLGVDQVWVQRDSAVQLLDQPAAGPPANAVMHASVAATTEGAPPISSVQRESQCQALALLGQAAALALEGRPRPEGAAGPIAAAVPAHAGQLLSWLLNAPRRPGATCEQFQEALQRTRDRPTEVSRGRRVAQLAVLAALLLVGVSCMLMIGVMIGPIEYFAEATEIQQGEELRQALETVAWRDLTVAAVNPTPLPRLRGCVQFQADLALLDKLGRQLEEERSRHRARLQALSWFGRQVARQFDSDIAASEKFEGWRELSLTRWRYRSPRLEAAYYRSTAPSMKEFRETIRGPFLWVLLIWPALWVIAAFVGRGGLTYLLTRLCLMNARGEPAARFRCAWRAALVWIPIAGLLMLSLVLDARYWSTWQPGASETLLLALANAVWYLAVGLLPIYAALALWSPIRGPHDRLSGTYLVPR